MIHHLANRVGGAVERLGRLRGDLRAVRLMGTTPATRSSSTTGTTTLRPALQRMDSDQIGELASGIVEEFARRLGPQRMMPPASP
jgi:hypothetical protein